MPRSVVSGLAAVLALAAIAFGLVRLMGDPRPARAGLPPLTAHRAEDRTPAERVDLRPGPADAVLTARGDLTRLGLDDHEPALSPAAVSSVRFGRRISYPVDGKIYAQPLYLPGLRIGGRVHDVVIVATEHDSVYAFEADATTAHGATAHGATAHGALPAPLWRVSLLMPGARPFEVAADRIGPPPGRPCDSIAPQAGVTSTPVVDWAAKTIFVMALDVERGVLTYRLHALDVYTGYDERAPVLVQAAVPGTGIDSAHGQVVFRATEEQQRLALTEVAGTVYAGFGSWCDVPPFHGWLIGFSAATLARTIVYNDSPDTYGGGLWESQAGITADAHGHLFLVSGDGPFDLDRGGRDAGDAVLEMVPQDGTLRVVDYFTPFNQRCLARHDLDLGSGSPLTVPGADELILTAKSGAVYVLGQSSLGGYHTIPGLCAPKAEARTDVDRIRQELPDSTVAGGVWGTWAYWAQETGRFVYASGAAGRLTQWRLRDDGTIDQVRVAQAPVAFGYPGAIPVTTGDRGRSGSGIVWTVDQTHGTVLRAFAADDVADELWSSERDAAANGMRPGDPVHFTVPVTADGKVIVADQTYLDIYGMLHG
ncbi:MAG: hypothetical protein JO345_01325 [Streptosporangiaceae bacterium]|nr:hypothetical protein [Streptosporangiaceae bacterium]